MNFTLSDGGERPSPVLGPLGQRLPLPDVTPGSCSSRVCPDGFANLFSLTSLFQIVRKVVRQIDSSGADDTQEHEEVIAEGPLEDPSELEADIDYFMKHAKVLRWLQPPRRPPSECPAPLPAAPLCASPSGFQSAPCSPLSGLPLEPPFPLAGPPQDAFQSLAYLSPRLSV